MPIKGFQQFCSLGWLLLALFGGPAYSDEITIRGSYYRDRNTRVLHPQVDVSKQYKDTTVGAHYVLDAITSASVAAGVLRDEPFTEYRNEFGFRMAQKIGRTELGASYSYSTESDYQAHLAMLSSTVDLWKHNTSLGLGLAYGHDSVAMRNGPTSFVPVGGLDTLQVIANWGQVLSKNLLFHLTYDLTVSGFSNVDNGFQANPYRPVTVAGQLARESVPYQRLRNALSASLHSYLQLGSKLVPYLAIRPSYRLYIDDWSLVAHTPELRLYVPIGPIEFRVTGRLHTQRSVSFWSSGADGRPVYPTGGLACASCISGAARGQKFYTSDPKLSTMSTYFFELRALLRCDWIPRLPAPLGRSLIEASYGYAINDRWANIQWGNAHIAALAFIFPL